MLSFLLGLGPRTIPVNLATFDSRRKKNFGPIAFGGRAGRERWKRRGGTGSARDASASSSRTGTRARGYWEELRNGCGGGRKIAIIPTSGIIRLRPGEMAEWLKAAVC